MTPIETPPEQPETPVEPGSLPLRMPRHEKFAHQIARGITQAKAYVEAGYPESETNATNASRLAQKPAVAQRIEWLKLQASKAAIYDAQRIEERLAYMADALSEIRIDPDTGDRMPGPMFNAHAAARTLESLARIKGMFRDKIELGGQVSVGNTEMLRKATPEQRHALREMLMKIQGQPMPANDDDPQPEGEAQPLNGVVPRGA